MNTINFKYFESQLEESVFDFNDQECFFCGKTNAPKAELDGSLNVISEAKLNDAEYVCLECLRKKQYAFEQEVEGGFLTKEGVLLESDKYEYLKSSSHYESEIIPREKQLLAMDVSKLQELMLTPPFRAWQGAKWLVHCNDFMKFIGTWQHEDFEKEAPDGNPENYFDQICMNGDGLYQDQFGPHKSKYAECTFYAFECIVCKAKRGYIDNA
jgi:uncharacterized protein CbrC (UPF0167 family)